MVMRGFIVYRGFFIFSLARRFVFECWVFVLVFCEKCGSELVQWNLLGLVA